MSRNVLLLEPNYKNKFPPIGLMKLATYFRLRGDNVVFYKGDLKEFLINDIANDCVAKLSQIDSTINWKLRFDKIANYIRYRRNADLEKIAIEDSSYSVLIYPWVDYYKNFYHKKEYIKNPKWDWVGVTTLFTFYWDITIETILFAKTMVKDIKNLMVGGVLASIQPKEIEEATGIKPHCGTLHTPYKDIDSDNPYIIDELPLDYSILDEIDYEYVDSRAFFSYATRGCIRRCSFCAVPILEPQFQPYLPLKERIDRTRRLYGDQQNLLLMDNNVLASKDLHSIIEDIRLCGFVPGAKYIEPNQYNIAIRNLRLGINDRAYIRKCWKLLKEINDLKSIGEEVRTYIYRLREQYGLLHPETCTKDALITTYKDFAKYFDKKYSKQKGRLRYIDFNQGVDARLFNTEIVALLTQIPVRPLRIAFDDVKTEKSYTDALKMSVSYGLKDFSNYLLYNFKDKPEDLYHRMRVNVDLCEELNVSIYSFPMKYHPIRDEHSHDRDYIGEHWNRKYIRAVQAILNATKGKIGRGVSFFEKAFGKNIEEYQKLLEMPETMIIYRYFFEWLDLEDARNIAKSIWGNDGICESSVSSWWKKFNECQLLLPHSEWQELLDFIHKSDFENSCKVQHPLAQQLLKFYTNHRKAIIEKGSELYKLKEEYDKNPLFSLRRLQIKDV